MKRKVKMGMIGGGRGAFIGAVHRIAALMDGHIELVCGALSSDPAKAKLSGADWYLPDDRSYGSYKEMIETEAGRPDGEKMDVVAIVTPNHLHYDPARMALEHGFHVVCDKPITYNREEAEKLAALVDKTGLIFALTHTYTGYPMVKEARDLIKSGKLGNLRKVVVEYPQGWLSRPIEQSGQKQAEWRTDPKRSGKAGSVGDIGTHAENLAEFMTGLKIRELCADVSTFVKNRQLDDDANVLIRMEKDVKGVLHCSQISAGEENNISIRIYGDQGGLEWHQQEPNTLLVKHLDKPMEVYRAGGDKSYLSSAAMAHQRTPGGHPEGYLEAFANIYRDVALAIQSRWENKKPESIIMDFPTVHDGIRGMRFIDAVIESGNKNAQWVKV